tara:strand:- start:93 stop:1259 length:1167 start_codon:yes stop_codon:yes gene_type:complete
MATKTKLTEGELFDPSTKTGWKLIPEQGWQYFDKGIVKTPGTTAKNTLKNVTGVVYGAGKNTRRYVDQFVEQDKQLRKKQRQSKIQEYKDFGKAVSEFDVEKEIKEEGGRVLKNLGNAFADIPKKFLTEPLESVTGSGVFQDGKELTVKQYKDSMTRARVAATENDSNSVSYGSDVGLGVENDIGEYFNYSGFDPNTDAGYFTASFDQTVDPISSFSKDLADRSLFNLKDNSAIGPSYYQAASMPVKLPVKELPTQKFAKSVTEPESPTDLTDSQAEAQETYGDASKGLKDNQVREWNTDMDVDDPGTITTIDPNREGYIGGKKQSAIQTKLLDSGFNKEQLSQLMQDHADWKADRKVDLGTSESATKAIEGGTNIFMTIQDLLRGGR